MSASIPADNLIEDKPTLESRHTGLLMAAVMAMAVCQFLDLTIANVALPHMKTSLGASNESISWTLTSYIIAGVIVLPLTGWLADRFGSRNLFFGASLLFVVASMLCGAATNLTQMVVFRALQGIAAAFIAPLSQAIVFDINRPSKQAGAMTIWGMVVMIAPISGPFIGGYLTEALSWRWVFYVNLPIGIPALVIIWLLLPSRPIIERKLDVFGAVWLAVSLCALQLMLDRGQSKDWLESPEIVIELIIALSAFWIFLIHSRSVDHPLFNRRMMSDPNFLSGLGFMLVLGVTNVALSSVLPSLFQNLYGYGVMDSGMLMAPRGFGLLLTMMLANKLQTRVDGRILITTGYLIAAVSLWMMTGWSLEVGQAQIVITGFVQGLGLGLVFMPVNMIAFSTLRPGDRTEGSTLMTLFRNLGSSFGISAIVTALARNIQTSHADIAGNVTSFSLPAVDPAGAAATLGALGEGLLAALDSEVNRQAAMIAYLDNFYMLFWLVLILAPVPWLLKRPRPPQYRQVADNH